MRFFSKQEDNFLKRNCCKIPAKRMAKMLGRTEATARQRMKLLGIVVPPEIIEKFKKDSQIKPGNVPKNKGKKMPKWVFDKVKRTMFKPGHVPINKKPVGSERITVDGYVEVKVKNPRTWKLRHRVVWEKKRGKIPAGKIVVFKDGNKQNLKLSNLKLISREQNMERNSYHRYGKEIAKTIQLMGALQRQINKHEKHTRPKRNAF